MKRVEQGAAGSEQSAVLCHEKGYVDWLATHRKEVAGMPIYEYQCRKCGHVAEFLETSSSRKRHVCEKCGSKSMKKVFSVFSARTDSGSSSASSSSCPTGTCSLS